MVTKKETRAQRYYRIHHKECLERQRKWRESHREYIRAVRKKYYYKNRKEEIRRRQEWRMANYKKDQETYRKYRLRTRDHQLARCLEYKNKQKSKVLSHYSNGRIECALCGHKDIDNLCIDHPKLDGASFRKKHKIKGGLDMHNWIIKHRYPTGLRVLCFNCNSPIKYKNQGKGHSWNWKLKLKQEVFGKYCQGNIQCQKCDIADIDKLVIHYMSGEARKKHKKLGIEKHVIAWLKKQGYPDGYQVLCYNCANKARYVEDH